MSKYIGLILKIMILLMFWISITRIRYIWNINKTSDSESNFIFRNQEGDWSIFFFIVLLMNKSRFDHFKFSYETLLRYFYPILIGVFIVYTVLQLTQLIVFTKDSLITQEATIESANIERYKVKKWLYGYKITVHYIKKEKLVYLSFFTTMKNKEIIEKRFQEQHVNIV